MNLVHLLLNNNRYTDARQLAQRLLDKAGSPQEAEIARDLLESVKEHEQWAAAQRTRRLEAEANAAKQSAVANAPATTQSTPNSSTTKPVDISKLLAVDGLVRGVDCSHKPAIRVTLSGGNRPLTFHAADFGAVGVTGEEIPGLESCEKWKGRRGRVWVFQGEGEDDFGGDTDFGVEWGGRLLGRPAG